MSALSGSDAIVQSQLMMAQAMGGLNEALNASTTMQTSTRNVVATIEVPAAVTSIAVSGVATVGDGLAGIYKRVGSDPGAAQKVQSADGAWWELAVPDVQATAVTSTTSVTATTDVSAGGAITAGTDISATGAVVAGTTVDAGTALQVSGTQVVGAQIAGWGGPTGTLSRATFDSDAINVNELAQRVAQLILDLKTHGLLGS